MKAFARSTNPESKKDGHTVTAHCFSTKDAGENDMQDSISEPLQSDTSHIIKTTEVTITLHTDDDKPGLGRVEWPTVSGTNRPEGTGEDRV